MIHGDTSIKALLSIYVVRFNIVSHLKPMQIAILGYHCPSRGPHPLVDKKAALCLTFAPDPFPFLKPANQRRIILDMRWLHPHRTASVDYVSLMNMIHHHHSSHHVNVEDRQNIYIKRKQKTSCTHSTHIHHSNMRNRCLAAWRDACRENRNYYECPTCKFK